MLIGGITAWPVIQLGPDGEPLYPGEVTVIPDTASSAVHTSIASSTSSQQALAANASRKMVMAYNTDANACYLKYGAGASSSSFMVKIASDGYWEMPPPIYTGRIDVLWAADGVGFLFLTEL